MNESKKDKQFDLEDRTLKFARNCRELIKNIPKTVGSLEDGKQLIRSSGSVGANYIEANESISKKDFNHRIKISRKESKESRYWLNLLDTSTDQSLEKLRHQLMQEATELTKIFSAIMRKSNQ
jgi:four helix bundle protein